MDINDLRGVMSALILITFIGLFVWTWMGRRDRFREAADLPFADEFADRESAVGARVHHELAHTPEEERSAR